MLFKRIYSIHTVLAILVFTNGCGVTTATKNDVPVFAVNTTMKSLQNISASERNIASNICLALKSKSQNFKTTENLGSKFVFQLKQNLCDVLTETINLNSNLILKSSDGTFHYSAINEYFNDFAQTDTSGYLTQICNKINNNLPISNTITINGVTVQITFFKDSLEGYTVQYFSADSTGISKIMSAETFRIRTQVNYTVGNIMGMDEYYKKEYICPTDANKTSTVEQKFFSR